MYYILGKALGGYIKHSARCVQQRTKLNKPDHSTAVVFSNKTTAVVEPNGRAVLESPFHLPAGFYRAVKQLGK